MFLMSPGVVLLLFPYASENRFKAYVYQVLTLGFSGGKILNYIFNFFDKGALQGYFFLNKLRYFLSFKKLYISFKLWGLLI